MINEIDVYTYMYMYDYVYNIIICDNTYFNTRS